MRSSMPGRLTVGKQLSDVFGYYRYCADPP